MVMATDIFDKEAKAFREKRWKQAFGSMESNLSEHDLQNLRATVMLELAIQASDVGHAMQHWHVYRKWNEKLFEEMVTAFQAGRSANDPTGGWYEGEIMFFDFDVIPLGDKLLESGAFGAAGDEYLEYAKHNRSEWAANGGGIVREMGAQFYQGQLATFLDSTHRIVEEEDNKSGLCFAS
jgi:hypothetical protein